MDKNFATKTLYVLVMTFVSSYLFLAPGKVFSDTNIPASVAPVIIAKLSSVSTEAVTNIKSDSAQGNAILLDSGGEDPVRFIEWGTTSGKYISGSCNVIEGPAGPYSCELIGLSPNTKYYVRAKAENSAGLAYGKEFIFTTSKQIAITQTLTDKILTNKIVKSSSAVVETAGLAAGATTAAATGTLPIFPLSPTPFSDIISRVFALFGVFSWKKKKKWGTVFDVETKRPISGAIISVINADGREVDAMTTNTDGMFGFLASKGDYSFRISKNDYELVVSNKQDEFYGELYNGKTFTIKEGEVAEMSIALRETNVDWQSFAKRKIAIYKTMLPIIRKNILVAFFYIGFTISASLLYLSPSIFSAIIVFLYLIMAIRNIFFKTKKYGLITTQEGNPIPFAMIGIYDRDNPEKRITFVVGDVIGRYFVLIKEGAYLMKIQGRELGGVSFKKIIDIEVKEGVFKEDIVVVGDDYLKIS